VAQEGTTYGLDEDITLETIYHDLKETVHGRSLRPTQFKHFSTYDSYGETSLNDLPELVHMKADKEPDSTFLREMVTLPQIVEKIEKSNMSAAENEQDIYFLEIHSLAELVKEYGINSQQVAEAGNMLRSQLEKVSLRMRNLYSDSIIVMTTMIDQVEQPSSTRSILQSAESGGDYNLAVEYSENYPAIFNIVLWGSIVLSLSILAISVSMATMDPGRDSIIYRMTNPRMKKDQ